jgi:putative addiction module component (TIGR02574 family)
MSSADLLKAAKTLPITERLELIDQLIESVESDSSLALSPQLQSELDRRYQDFKENPDQGEPWEVVRERIQRSLDAAANRRPG